MKPMNETGHDDTTEPRTVEKIDVKSNDVTPGTERTGRRPEQTSQTSQPSRPSQSGRTSESGAARGPVTPDRTADPRESAEPERAARAPHTPREPGAPGATAEDTDKLRRRLQQAVGGFVDEPRHAVEEADHVLEEATERLVRELEAKRHELRTGWDGGQSRTGTDTEKLRLALQGYRELVDRVLHV
ncbi:hypothetical protein [Streptomyces sp. NPDC088733]|uniref:hypothetical protein n=1 Tax=Streptomyces sp. NPDC088733 TaxID=3365880 RepID=UPI0037F38FBB